MEQAADTQTSELGDQRPSADPADGAAQPPPARLPTAKMPAAKMPIEIGGPAGPEPTRYGDWEQKGRCTDF